MPKVKVQGTKGLFQESGTGFAFVDNQVEPSVETLTNQLVDLTLSVGTVTPGDDTAWMNGYFLLYSSTAEYVVWFNMDSVSSSSNGAQPTVPSNGYPQKFIEVEPAGATIDEVCDAVETALSASGVPFKAYNDGSGIMEIVGDTPYANVKAASAGSLPSTIITIAQTTTGSGSGTKAIALDKEITVIDQCNPDASIADQAGQTPANDVVDACGLLTTDSPFTLADGTFIGQKKTIILNPSLDAHQTAFISIASSYDISRDQDESNNEVNGEASHVGLLTLMWTGVAWLNVVDNANGVAGLTA